MHLRDYLLMLPCVFLEKRMQTMSCMDLLIYFPGLLGDMQKDIETRRPLWMLISRRFSSTSKRKYMLPVRSTLSWCISLPLLQISKKESKNPILQRSRGIRLFPQALEKNIRTDIGKTDHSTLSHAIYRAG